MRKVLMLIAMMVMSGTAFAGAINPLDNKYGKCLTIANTTCNTWGFYAGTSGMSQDEYFACKIREDKACACAHKKIPASQCN